MAKFEEWLTEEGLTKIEGWARDGLTDKQIAKNCGVSERTFTKWKSKYTAIKSALKKGKEVVDYEVESALYRRAIGFEYKETKRRIEVTPEGEERQVIEEYTKQALPDPTAIVFWLKNRKPDRWRQMSPEFRRKVEAETDKLKADTELSKQELQRLKEEVAGEETKVVFLDTSEEMRKWLNDNKDK